MYCVNRPSNAKVSGVRSEHFLSVRRESIIGRIYFIKNLKNNKGAARPCDLCDVNPWYRVR